MSFRRRNEPLGTNPRRFPTTTPLQCPRTPAPGVLLLPLNHTTRPGQALLAPTDKRHIAKTKNAANIAVKPSLATSQPVVSTGCADLDRLLVHLGLPLSNMLLVEESGTTDFSLVLLRTFASQGMVHNRLRSPVGSAKTHVVAIGVPSSWAHDLPGEYKGTSKEQKKAQISQDSTQISVANMALKDLKIAWRYGLLKSTLDKSADSNDCLTSSSVYLSQFDITQRLEPVAGPQDITFIPIAPAYTTVVEQVMRVVKAHVSKNDLVRIVAPGLLHPSLYPPECCLPAYIVPLIHSLRALVADTSLVFIASVHLDLYPRDGLITHMLETVMDGVVHLQPFNAGMTALLERAYKNESAKVQQGWINVVKLPVLSARGMMVVTQGEYAFKNGKKKFAIEEWGIPVEDSDEGNGAEKKVDF
ncbi:PAXNEB-domain-containing protein [Metschnikowia bicuspidata]|uniref:Elongator complex protein 4 n=1 Tax=Metschnikowia bicuspidata TaxID=27322 RepID=A0A4P9Z8M0_9ASCO|nr:PAXNEB-domain-containing protein [Metschnikowia bicuspidata]